MESRTRRRTTIAVTATDAVKPKPGRGRLAATILAAGLVAAAGIGVASASPMTSAPPAADGLSEVGQTTPLPFQIAETFDNAVYQITFVQGATQQAATMKLAVDPDKGQIVVWPPDRNRRGSPVLRGFGLTRVPGPPVIGVSPKTCIWASPDPDSLDIVCDYELRQVQGVPVPRAAAVVAGTYRLTINLFRPSPGNGNSQEFKEGNLEGEFHLLATGGVDDLVGFGTVRATKVGS